jgi:hypothetical protein
MNSPPKRAGYFSACARSAKAAATPKAILRSGAVSHQLLETLGTIRRISKRLG